MAKILFAANSFFPAIGGAEKVCKDMVDILKKTGHNVTVLTQPCAERSQINGIAEFSAKTSYSIMKNLPNYLKNNEFDLYIGFGYGKSFNDYIGRWAHNHKKPFIYMPCGDFHTNSNKLFKKFYSFVLGGKTFKRANIIVTATEWEKQHWIDKYNLPKDNIVVIPYNLDKNFSKFKQTDILKRNKLKKKKYLLHIGRTGPNKLISLITESYNKTTKLFPLVIAGKGTEQFDYRPMAEIKLLNITDEERNIIKKDMNILSLGPVSENDKKTLIKNAGLCIFSSSYESFGVVILESLALGTPVIGSNIGPFRELLKDEIYLFENNSDSLSDKIRQSYIRNYNLAQVNLPDQEKLLNNLVNLVLSAR